MEELRFALTHEADQCAENLRLLDLRSFSRPKTVGKCVQTANLGHLANQSQADMANVISFVSLDIGDEHCRLLPHPVGAKLIQEKKVHASGSLIYFKYKVFQYCIFNATFSRIKNIHKFKTIILKIILQYVLKLDVL